MNERSPNDDLQRAYGDARRAQPACPTADEIRRFRQDELTEEHAEAVAFHLADCAECIELIERLESPGTVVDLDPGEEARLEREIAAGLGLRREPARSGLRRAFSWLWTVRTPLFVPAAAALLLLVLLLRGGPVFGPPADPASGILPVKSILIDQAALRSAGEETAKPAIAAGDVVLIEIFLDGLAHRPGDPVTCVVLDSEGRELWRVETAVLEDYNIRTVVRFSNPGAYTLRVTAADGGNLLESVPIRVDRRAG